MEAGLWGFAGPLPAHRQGLYIVIGGAFMVFKSPIKCYTLLMYYLKHTSSALNKGILYKFEAGKKKLVQKDFDFSLCSDNFIKGSIICNWIAEGQTLHMLNNAQNLGFPTKVEFYSWINNDTQLKILFEQSKDHRLATVTEDLYQVIKSSELTDDSVNKITALITRLEKHSKDIAKVVVNTRVYVPPVLKEWYAKNS